MCAVGCSPRIVIQRDTLCTTREVIKEVLRDTTIYVTLPSDSVAVSTYDTLSVLSTKIARSTASISQGMLTHTLSNNSDYRPEIVVQYKDRIVTKDSIVVVRQDVPVEVEKKLSWWQKILQKLGYIGIGAIAAAIAWLVFKAVKK